MNLQQLEYLNKIAETKSFTLAAESISVTQPALSKAISKLEEELNVTLIEREGRSIKLTKFGEAFLKHAKSALISIENGIKEIEDIKRENENIISISSTDCVGASFMPFIISDFLNFYNNTKFNFNNEPIEKILNNLNNNKIDIGFFDSIKDINNYEEIEFTEVNKEKYVLVVPKNHHLANKSEVSLKDLKEESFIVFSECSNKIMSYCELIDYTPKISVQPKEASMLGALVSAGAGITIIPNTPMINTNKISILDIKEDIGYKTIYMGWNKNSKKSSVINIFIEHIINNYKSSI